VSLSVVDVPLVEGRRYIRESIREERRWVVGIEGRGWAGGLVVVVVGVVMLGFSGGSEREERREVEKRERGEGGGAEEGRRRRSMVGFVFNDMGGL